MYSVFVQALTRLCRKKTVSEQQFERFGKYLLLEKIATGGMAEVFLARSNGTGGIAKFFAIKRILPQYAEVQEFIDMFKDEAKIAVNLNHSNIVSIHEFGVQNKQFYLVMDYVEGRNLRQILNKMKKSSAQFSIDQIVYMVKEVAAGLDHAHRCLDANTGKPLNITHRDMSPQNIMVSFEGELKVVDFGIAKAESQLENTRAGTLKGKFGYMSPEQAEGQPIDLRTDIFSLGIVLWELLANDRLFTANNELNTLRKIRDCQIPSLRKINPNIHPELERIAQKALARDRNLRYQTAAAFHRDLNRFLNRQYPDFSPHDFSVFIKSIFAEDIMSIRKRLVEYSKIGGSDSAQVDDRTVVTDTQTNSLVLTQTGPQGLSLNEQAVNKPAAPAIPSQESGSKVILDEALLTKESQRKIDVKPQVEYQLEDSESSYHRNTQSRISRYSQVRYQLPKDENPSVRVSTLVIFVVAVIAFYSYLVKYHTATMASVIHATQPVLGPLHAALGVSGSIDRASLAQQRARTAQAQAPASVPEAAPVQPVPAPQPEVAPENATTFAVVSSQPSGAAIYIDGRDTGMITPSRVNIPTGRAFQFQLKRLGYRDFVKNDMTVQQMGSHFTATLREVDYAYLDIDVIPPKNAKLLINGTVAGDRAPYRNVAIPANAQTRIRVEDNSGSWDETIIQLGKNQRKRIILNLHTRMAN